MDLIEKKKTWRPSETLLYLSFFLLKLSKSGLKKPSLSYDTSSNEFQAKNLASADQQKKT